VPAARAGRYSSPARTLTAGWRRQQTDVNLAREEAAISRGSLKLNFELKKATLTNIKGFLASKSELTDQSCFRSVPVVRCGCVSEGFDRWRHMSPAATAMARTIQTTM
jgi:hypothetical protein